MKIDRFDYHFPNERIAPEHCDAGRFRLMVIHRNPNHRACTSFQRSDYLPMITTLFRNNAAVLKARITEQHFREERSNAFCSKPTEDAVTWWCLLKPGKKTFQAGSFGSRGDYSASAPETGANEDYKYASNSRRIGDQPCNRLGIMPLPPYVEHEQLDPRITADNERYQTVYAKITTSKSLLPRLPAGLRFSSN